MPYRPQAPPLIQIEGDPPDVYVGSHIPEKPVTPVTAVTEMLNMTLGRFEAEGKPLEVRVPWLAETLWWVPGLQQVATLMALGVSRGRIWTARELADLAKIGARDIEGMRTIARTKLDLDGEIESVDVEPAQLLLPKGEPPR